LHPLEEALLGTNNAPPKYWVPGHDWWLALGALVNFGVETAMALQLTRGSITLEWIMLGKFAHPPRQLQTRNGRSSPRCATKPSVPISCGKLTERLALALVVGPSPAMRVQMPANADKDERHIRHKR
jgi:hypothetical protein